MSEHAAGPGWPGVVARGMAALVALAGGLFGLYAALAHVSDGERSLPGGITLEVARAREGGEGRVFVARIPLDPASIELFLTPPAEGSRSGSRDDPTAWTHRLAHTAHTARRERLTVAVNASLFAGGSWPVRRPGEPARLTETVVLAGRTYARWEHSYMLGFLPDLTPQPVRHKPPPPDSSLAAWQLGISSQSWQLFDGERGWWEQALRRPRTVLGVHPDRRLLWLAVCDHATLAESAAELQRRGATHILHLDGGGSSAMAVNGRAVFGDWRPVLNHFGVRTR